MTRKPSSQQVFWHSGFFFLRSFSQFFLHFFMVFGFLLHFFFLILHFLLSTKPSQSTLGGGGEGGNGSHSPQVFLHFASFAGS